MLVSSKSVLTVSEINNNKKIFQIIYLKKINFCIFFIIDIVFLID